MSRDNIFNDIHLIRRKLGEKSIKAFAELFFPHYLSKKSCLFHEELYKMLEEMSEKRGERLAVAAPRASAKSSIVSLIYVIRSIAYKKENYIMLLSDTREQAEAFLSHIKDELETNERLIESFPEICETGQKPMPPRWTRNEIVTRNGIKLTVLGSGQKIRGRRSKEARPSLIILDDIENDENTQSEESREKLFSWFSKAVLKAGSGATNVVVIGTIQHYDSLLAKLVNEDGMPGWTKKKYKSVIQWATRIDLWQRWKLIFNNREPYSGKMGKEAALAFYFANKDAMLEGAEVLWKEKEDYYSLMVMRESELEGSFDSEKQNEPVSYERSLFNPAEFRYYNDMYRSTEELLQWMGDNADIMGSCDPATGEFTNKGDYTAITIAARDRRDGIVYIIESDIARRTPANTVETIIAYCKRYKIKKFAAEANYFQTVLVQDLEKRVRKEGLYQTEIIAIKNSINKRERIQSLHPLIKNGTIVFNKFHQQLLDQFRYFPKGRYDDAPDAVHLLMEICCLPINEFMHWFAGDPEPWRDPNKLVRLGEYGRRFHG